MKEDPKTIQAPEFLNRSDFELALAAKNAIELLVTAPKEAIRVTVRDGWISLAGKAEGSSQRGAAEFAVRNLPGVRGVTNLIRMTSPSSLSPPGLAGTNGVRNEQTRKPI
ncbi:MAG: BON domain-containing protein [Verrucomicrobiota bacterium]|jgi:osmotically-inducible protein OsmY